MKTTEVSIQRMPSDRGSGREAPPPRFGLRIGSLTLENPLILAPMAGFTDLPFRRICRQMGASLVHTEMISAKGLVLNAPNTRRLLQSDGTDRPLVVQLFGSDPETMAEAAEICQHWGADMIDINMGCPVPKVIRKGAGAALLRDPDRALKVLRAVRRAVTVPLTIKMRAGWKAGEFVAMEIALGAQDCGVDAVTLHPRSRTQTYGTPADWDLIRRLKDTLSIPVIGNGDVLTGEDAVRMMKETACDGVMIARGALGNPWIFSRALALLQGKDLPAPDLASIRRMLFRHLEGIRSHLSEKRALHTAKVHAMKYTRGLPYSHRLRKEIVQSSDLPSLLHSLEGYFGERNQSSIS